MEEVYSRTRELWSIDEEGDTIDARRIFDRRERVVLEIGAGRGDLAIDAALRNDDLGLIAIDVHTRGIANMLSAIELHGLSNLRVVEGDAQVFVRRLPDDCLDEIWVFFPDPWPKARHRNRRLLRADMIATLTRPLRAGGVLRLATDIDDYARTATRAIEQSGLFEPPSTGRPDWRIETVFEKRGFSEGRLSVDLSWRKISQAEA